MKVTLDVPPISLCTATECAYNVSEQCRAGSITVGDGIEPRCDTLFRSARKTTRSARTGVGPCKSVECRYNREFSCTAVAISVGGGTARCLTFDTREE